MAYDFPASPTIGQVSNGFVWNGQAWTGNGNLSAVAPPSEGPPANPVNGQLWWESDSGNLFVWYVDANSSQWVQISGPGLGDAPSDGKGYIRQNGVWTAGWAPISRIKPASNTANVPFAIPAETAALRLTGVNIPVALNAAAALQLSTDGGATWKTTGQYTIGRTWFAGASPGSVGGEYATHAFIRISDYGDTAETSLGHVDIVIALPKASMRGKWSVINSEWKSGQGLGLTTIVGMTSFNGVATHARVVETSGDIAVGTDIMVEGLL